MTLRWNGGQADGHGRERESARSEGEIGERESVGSYQSKVLLDSFLGDCWRGKMIIIIFGMTLKISFNRVFFNPLGDALLC
jgi:hypothetical protein